MLRAILVCVSWLLTLPAAAQPTVSAVRVGEHPDKTRFVMELSEEPRYRVFTLADPFRVVIDLPEVEWAPKSDVPRAGDGLITAMRFGLFAPGTSRVVLDMRGPVRVRNVFLIAPQERYPHRLVVDVVPVSRQAYFADGQARPIVSRIPLEPVRTGVVTPMRPKADARPTVVIDPGHGGVDPGARSITGVDEKEIALAFALDLRRLLEAAGRYRVVLTRDKDMFVQLRDRMETAQRLEGDLFISLHANNHDLPKVRGASVYTLSERASDAEAEALAAKENKADIIAGVNLSDQTEVVSKILIDLAQRETMNLSKHFANMLVNELGEVTRLLRNTHRYAGFAVLKSPTVPSVLVEVGYLSNRQEEGQLRSSRHREAIAGATVRAINAYFAWQEALNRS